MTVAAVLESLSPAASFGNVKITGSNGVANGKHRHEELPSPLKKKLELGGIHAQDFRRGPKPNVALFVTKGHDLYQEEIPYPVCGPNDCVVHVKCTGICGSEIHFWKTGRIGDCKVDHDLMLGHESAGDVLEVGANVQNLQVGDKVSIEPGVACFACKQCLGGRYNLCPKVAFSGTPPSHGTMARYIAHPAKFLHKMPASMSYKQGALVEPLSVAVGAVERARPGLGQPVLVCGAGPIGLAAAISARAAGAHPVCVTDLDENRLKQARAFGFDLTIKVDLSWTREQFAAKVRTTMGDDCHPEIAFECTGAQSSIAGSIYALVDGGTLLQVGCGKPEIELPLMAMSFREVNIITSFRYHGTWPKVIRLLHEGVLSADGFVTHSFPLEQTLTAFETCITPSAKSIKVQIVDE